MPSNEREPLLSRHPSNGQQHQSGWKGRLSDSIDEKGCEAALNWQCIISGAADAASFSQTGTWVGFMTGNITQLTIAFTETIMTKPTPASSVLRIWHSSSSVLGFIFGALLANWIDGMFHGKHRGKLTFTALCRAMIFALLIPFLALYGWTGWSGLTVLFMMSINMGSMAVCSLKLGSTPYSTTVVFTSTLASLFSDPLLPTSLSKASLARAKSIAGLIIGGAASQFIMILTSRYFGQENGESKEKPIGSAFAIGLVAMFEIICSFAWWNAKSSSQSV